MRAIWRNRTGVSRADEAAKLVGVPKARVLSAFATGRGKTAGVALMRADQPIAAAVHWRWHPHLMGCDLPTTNVPSTFTRPLFLLRTAFVARNDGASLRGSTVLQQYSLWRYGLPPEAPQERPRSAPLLRGLSFAGA